MTSDRAVAYGARVEQWLLRALERGARDLSGLAFGLPGVYPTEIRAAVFRLVAAGRIEWSASTGLLRPPTPDDSDADPLDQLLPVPHPLDFDWRFESRTAESIAARAAQLAGREGAVTYLGTPSAFLASSGIGPESMLLDASAPTVAALQQAGLGDRAVRCDVGRDRLPPQQAKVVVADPPWYVQHYRCFIWAAAQLLEPNGTLLLALPPLGTRPGIEDDRGLIANWAERCGFQLVVHEPGGVRYSSPPFERNALRAAGLEYIAPTWRQGDLAEFRLAAAVQLRRPLLRGAGNQDWLEVANDGVRLRFRRPPRVTASGDPRLRTIVPGHILPSVSRRDPRRRRAMVWTAGNRVFSCHDPEFAAVIASSLFGDRSVMDAAVIYIGRRLLARETRHMFLATQQLADLIQIEQAEIEAWQSSRFRRVAEAS